MYNLNISTFTTWGKNKRFYCFNTYVNNFNVCNGCIVDDTNYYNYYKGAKQKILINH